jgi:plasmid stabilization system protein ParE
MKLVWAKKAQKRMGEILDYIQFEFANTSRESFRAKAKDFTKLLVEFS